MGTQEQQTCGRGLAENSILPAKLAQLLAAMTENLAVHRTALDPTDPKARAESDAYDGLVRDFQQIVASLEAIAHQMAGYHDLPMAPHDEKAMSHPRVLAAFQAFVNRKQELLALLEDTTERDDKLLAIMRAHSAT